jgi:hypothetical protein
MMDVSHRTPEEKKRWTASQVKTPARSPWTNICSLRPG